MMLKVILVSLAISCASAIVCEPDICARVRCAAVTAESCANGNIVQGGGYCGCCDACVQTLAEGSSCLSTILLGVPATATCDDGLICDPATHTCQKPSVLLQGVVKRQISVVPAGTTTALSCAQRVLQMQTASSNGLPLLGQTIPKCAADGSYAPRQCEGSVCYCVDPNGNQIPGYTANIGDSGNMDCQCARDQYAYQQTGLIGRLFTCTNTGSYQRYACTGSVCYCADNLGQMRTGTQTVNIGNIGALQC
ncbi:hypothetical protein BaRGS_00025744 [Batillaria attramentaria]|uniref:Thyroglobulin type-1 domain-containing protein n=1 Tax=Batillaria attramentaria TaxID=370345 RepID=A0ABD0K766_9CAEN